MKVIFLDVDGVLNSEIFFRANHINGLLDEIDRSKVALLKEIVDRTHADLVLSSSWRVAYTPDDDSHPCYKLIKILKEFNLTITDFTPVLHENRGYEIQAYLNQHHVDKFVILDDESDMNDLLPYLVKTTFKYGLTKTKAEECIKKLEDK